MVEDDVLYHSEQESMMDLVIEDQEYGSGVKLSSVKDDGEYSHSVPVFHDEIPGVVGALVRSYLEAFSDV